MNQSVNCESHIDQIANMYFGRFKELNAYDYAFISIFRQEFYEIEVTEERVIAAAERLKKFNDRPGQPRSDAKKLIDALMELAELPFKQLGSGKDSYDDASASGYVIRGVIEVKTVALKSNHKKIHCSQAYDYMVVVERESTGTLAKKVEQNGIDFLIGYKLKFYPKAVYRWTGKERELCFEK